MSNNNEKVSVSSDIPQLTLVYKVVSNNNGRMFSVNPGRSVVQMALREEALYTERKHNHHINDFSHYLVEYKFNEIVLPFAARPLLFICNTLEDAQKAVVYYEENREMTVEILIGWGANVQPYTDEGYNKGIYKSIQVIPPSEFKTYFCDWFIPLRKV